MRFEWNKVAVGGDSADALKRGCLSGTSRSNKKTDRLDRYLRDKKKMKKGRNNHSEEPLDDGRVQRVTGGNCSEVFNDF